MDVGLQQPKTSQFPWVSHPDAVPVEIWETPPAVRRRRGVSHIPTGCRIQLGFYSFKCDKGGIAFIIIIHLHNRRLSIIHFKIIKKNINEFFSHIHTFGGGNYLTVEMANIATTRTIIATMILPVIDKMIWRTNNFFKP